MPFIDLSTGARLHYEDLGSGSETVLALHGMLGTARLHFPRIIEWLSPHYRFVGPSLRGYGQSEPKPRDFPLDFYHRDAADVLALMDALKLDRVHLLGYSDGGEVALVAAGTQPERFRSVAVWGAVGYFGPELRSAVQRMYPPDWLKPEDLAPHGLSDKDAFVLAWMTAAKHMIDSGGDVSLSLADRVACPLLLMLGEHDRLNPVEYGRAFVSRAQNGRLEVFPCGHAVHDEQWDAFRRVVGEFLTSAQAR